jgi:hypothetical protein
MDCLDDVSDEDSKLRRGAVRESTTANTAVKNEISGVTQRYFRVWKHSHRNRLLLRRPFCRCAAAVELAFAPSF